MYQCPMQATGMAGHGRDPTPRGVVQLDRKPTGAAGDRLELIGALWWALVLRHRIDAGHGGPPEHVAAKQALAATPAGV
jgi:hypothetical protein